MSRQKFFLKFLLSMALSFPLTSCAFLYRQSEFSGPIPKTVKYCEATVLHSKSWMKVKPENSGELIAVGPLVLPIIPLTLSSGGQLDRLTFSLTVDPQLVDSSEIKKRFLLPKNWQLKLNSQQFTAVAVAPSHLNGVHTIVFYFPPQSVDDIELIFSDGSKEGPSTIHYSHIRRWRYSPLGLYPLFASACAKRD